MHDLKVAIPCTLLHIEVDTSFIIIYDYLLAKNKLVKHFFSGFAGCKLWLLEDSILIDSQIK